MEDMRHAQGTLVGKLLTHQLVGQEPAYQNTSQETRYRQENLTCYEVEDIKQSLTKEIQ